MKSILIGSPIYQKAVILKEFLASLANLDTEELVIAYLFVDDNSEVESSEQLGAFARQYKNVEIVFTEQSEAYVVDEDTHRWHQKNIDKVTQFKNYMIKKAITKQYDYLFLIDSDIILHPNTLKQLLSDQKDIVSNIFWTAWQPGTEPMPQVWVRDRYAFHEYRSNDLITDEDIHRQEKAFIEKLKRPGIYRVGGLGACTLISQRALATGVNFDELYNVSFRGEDRHFCIRAVALGLELFVDTHYPAYHIYRLEDLKGVAHYKESCITRTSEIRKEMIRQVVEEGLEALMKFSYDRPMSEYFKKYFTQEGARDQWEQLKEQRKIVEILQFVSEAKVSNFEMDDQEFGTKRICYVQICIKGYRQGVSFAEQFRCKCMVEEEDGYKISLFQVEQPIAFTHPPLIRRVSESPQLTLSMCVKDEEKRYLERMLLETREHIDHAVIIDDGSTDHTVELCYDLLGDKLKLVKNQMTQGENQAVLRYEQWQETIRTNPEWMLFLDADELLEERAGFLLPQMMRNREIDSYIFRIYDFWDEEDYYRDDDRWCRHMAFRPFMTRYQQNYQYEFNPFARNESRLPINVLQLGYAKTDLRIKHYGYFKKEDRMRKYDEYRRLDPDNRYMSQSYYEALIEEHVKTTKWSDYHINA